MDTRVKPAYDAPVLVSAASETPKAMTPIGVPGQARSAAARARQYASPSRRRHADMDLRAALHVHIGHCAQDGSTAGIFSVDEQISVRDRRDRGAIAYRAEIRVRRPGEVKPVIRVGVQDTVSVGEKRAAMNDEGPAQDHLDKVPSIALLAPRELPMSGSAIRRQAGTPLTSYVCRENFSEEKNAACPRFSSVIQSGSESCRGQDANDRGGFSRFDGFFPLPLKRRQHRTHRQHRRRDIERI
jgi:hypothetical protein